MNNIYYICDGKACGDNCPNVFCFRTSNIEHAINHGNGIFQDIYLGQPWCKTAHVEENNTTRMTRYYNDRFSNNGIWPDYYQERDTK